MRWDIFCKVIDNHGDIGVCWRLAAQLAARGEAVRLWVDDDSALGWMAPQGAAGVQVLPWMSNWKPRPGLPSSSASTTHSPGSGTTAWAMETANANTTAAMKRNIDTLLFWCCKL